MPDTSLAEALTQEHHEIDMAIEEFVAEVNHGQVSVERLTGALELLRRHIYLEEEFLFPAVRGAGLEMPVQVMLREHGQLWRTMDNLEVSLAEVGDSQAPRLLAACRELLAGLDQHNRKEEPIIYPRADSELKAEAAAELAQFLQAGRTPSGWVCQEANENREAGGRQMPF